jgi:hypothetical protein
MDGAPCARRRQPWSSGPRRRRRTPPSASEVDLSPSRHPSSAQGRGVCQIWRKQRAVLFCSPSCRTPLRAASPG